MKASLAVGAVVLAGMLLPGVASADLVFMSNRCMGQYDGCRPAIWRADDDGAAGLRRLDVPGDPYVNEESAAFTLGGTQIVFVRELRGPPGNHPIRDELWAMNADGSDPHLLRGPLGEGNDAFYRDVDPSPDGRWVAISKLPPEGTPGRRGVPAIYAVPLDGGPPRRLTDSPNWGDFRPEFSPDGQRIAFVRTPGGPDDGEADKAGVYAVNLAGGAEYPLALGGLEEDWPTWSGDVAWSPDGRSLAFTGVRTIYTMSADGSDIHVVARDKVNANSRIAWMGGTRNAVLFDGVMVPARPEETMGQPNWWNSDSPLYAVDVSGDRPPAAFTPWPTDTDFHGGFRGDRAPDWSGPGPPTLATDKQPPAVTLISAQSRQALASASGRKPHVKTVRRSQLRFLAVDPTGIRRVEAALGRRVRKGRRTLCRFASGSKLGRARSCRKRGFQRVRSSGRWDAMVGRLKPGTYEITLRARDRRGNRSRRGRMTIVRLRR